jgi:hypothetical protein
VTTIRPCHDPAHYLLPIVPVVLHPKNIIMSTEKETISEKIIAGLRKAADEMEELRVQIALGKLEARDLYEEKKKQFNHFLHEAKQKMAP